MVPWVATAVKVNVPTARVDVSVVRLTLPLPSPAAFACQYWLPIKSVADTTLVGPIVCVPVPVGANEIPTVRTPSLPPMATVPADLTVTTVTPFQAVPSIDADMELELFGPVGLLLPPPQACARSSAVDSAAKDERRMVLFGSDGLKIVRASLAMLLCGQSSPEPS